MVHNKLPEEKRELARAKTTDQPREPLAHPAFFPLIAVWLFCS